MGGDLIGGGSGKCEEKFVLTAEVSDLGISVFQTAVCQAAGQ